ncbi:MAG: hypothetical protein R2750_07505 [Bacteroidales bacterium]
MKKILGLDLGTNSIGWALIEQDFEKRQGKILGMGSRIIPMGSDKIDYEKGIGITKNATRREKRTARKMNKRYKIRRNKLLIILYELGMLPDQFQFKNGIPEPNRIQELELCSIKKGMMQLDSLEHYKLRVHALGLDKEDNPLQLKELGKIFYQFNQLRGYAGGNNEEDAISNIEDDVVDETEKKRYEVITKKVEILKVEKSNSTYKVRGGISKGQELNRYDVIIGLNNEVFEGETELQNLEEKIGKEEELEIRIKRNKKGEVSYLFALPKKTNWRKQMEATEETLKNENLYVSQLIVNELEQNKWTKIRNRVFLRHRYQAEFDAIWDFQYNNNPEFKKTVDDNNKLERIINYIFPERDKSKPETEETKKSKKEVYKARAREKGL